MSAELLAFSVFLFSVFLFFPCISKNGERIMMKGRRQLPLGGWVHELHMA